MYEAGAFVAFLLWAYSVTMTVVRLNSRLARNLRTVGLRVRWSGAAPTRMERADYGPRPGWTTAKILFFAVSGLFSIILSWVAVAWHVGSMLYFHQLQSGKPSAMREFEWRMRNVEMSFDQIIEAMAAAKMLGKR